MPKSPVGGLSRRPAQTLAGLPALDLAAGRVIIQNLRPVTEGRVSRGRGRSPPSPHLAQHSLLAAPSMATEVRARPGGLGCQVGLGSAAQPREPGAVATVHLEPRLGAWAFLPRPQSLSLGQWWTPFRKLPPSALCPSHGCWVPCVSGPGPDIDPRSRQAHRSEGQTCWRVPPGSSSTWPTVPLSPPEVV